MVCLSSLFFNPAVSIVRFFLVLLRSYNCSTLSFLQLWYKLAIFLLHLHLTIKLTFYWCVQRNLSHFAFLVCLFACLLAYLPILLIFHFAYMPIYSFCSFPILLTYIFAYFSICAFPTLLNPSVTFFLASISWRPFLLIFFLVFLFLCSFIPSPA